MNPPAIPLCSRGPVSAEPQLASLSLSLSRACSPLYLSRNIDIEALCAAPPEALAHSPSKMPLSCQVAPPKRQMPLSCPVAPPSQRELHKDGGGGGDGVARRARAARAPKAQSCAMFSATPSATPCAASLTCWRRLLLWWREGGQMCRRVVIVAHRWPHMHAPGGRRGGPP